MEIFKSSNEPKSKYNKRRNQEQSLAFFSSEWFEKLFIAELVFNRYSRRRRRRCLAGKRFSDTRDDKTLVRKEDREG